MFWTCEYFKALCGAHNIVFVEMNAWHADSACSEIKIEKKGNKFMCGSVGGGEGAKRYALLASYVIRRIKKKILFFLCQKTRRTWRSVIYDYHTAKLYCRVISEKNCFSRVQIANVSQLNGNLFVRFDWMQHTAVQTRKKNKFFFVGEKFMFDMAHRIHTIIHISSSNRTHLHRSRFRSICAHSEYHIQRSKFTRRAA